MERLGWLWILVIGVPALVVFFRRLRHASVATVCGGLLTLNALIVIAAAALLLSDVPAFSQPAAETGKAADTAESPEKPGGAAGGVAVGAALAAGLAAIGAGIAVGITGSAAIGAITEKPEMLGRSLIFVGLAEGIAIYGLIIAFMILTGGFEG